MDIGSINSDDAKNRSIEDLFGALQSSKDGLQTGEAGSRLEKCGPNAIEEKKTPLLFKIFLYFWGPIPWMIEAAAILSFLAHHYDDFYIILSLLLVNGVVHFWEEFEAGNAIEALKQQLALKSMVKRDGNFVEVDAKFLVPGDVVKLTLGNVIPADVKLFEGEYLSIDQSTLTGESLPVSKKAGDIAFSGSVAKQGEMIGLVTATGSETFFGKTTKLVEKAKPKSHFQEAVLKIGNFLIYLSLALSVLLIGVQLSRGADFLQLVQYILVLIVASIPVAMPAVLSVTMALGALVLSKMKAVVTRLESIEEIAGIDILCSDKTGTLTQNSLTLGELKTFNEKSPEELILFAALSSNPDSQDPIDLAILKGVQNQESLKGFTKEKFTPFDPVRKKADSQLKTGDGKTVFAEKGAPQVILGDCKPDENLKKQVEDAVGAFAAKGNRTLGVAKSEDGQNWEFLGLVPLYDPLREDSKQTVQEAKEHGIEIKMLTGDNIAIAKEIAGELSLGDQIGVAGELFGDNKQGSIETIERMNGFAEVFPEHKYEIVKSLQEHGHIVGMTGDGVNDAPALKQVDVGIAVSGATDAARAAASLVLLEPGLSVIVRAVEEARRIFERMTSYSIYRITETIRIMLFMVASILAFNFYPVTAIMIILLALLNDLPILTIAYDNTVLPNQPVKWEMKKVLTIATSLGLIGIIETFIALFIAKDFFLLSDAMIQSFIFLKLSVAGHQTLFIARARGPFFLKPWPSPILAGAIVITQIIAACIVGFGIFVEALPWKYVGFIWLYTIGWMFVEDLIKLFLYKRIKSF